MYKLVNHIWEKLSLFWQHTKKPLFVFSSFTRIIWLLFPSIVFLFAAWACFWSLPQGKDVLIDMLEKKWIGGIVLLAVLFWVTVSWYSSRILIYRKKQLYTDTEKIAFHTPRLIGFLAFSLIWIAFLRLPKDAYLHFHLRKGFDWVLVLISVAVYFGLDKIFRLYRDEKLKIRKNENTDSASLLTKKEKKEKGRFKKVFIVMASFVVLLLVLNTLIKNAWLLVISLILLQSIFLFIVIIRRGRVELVEKTTHGFKMPLDYPSIKDWQQAEKERGNRFNIGLWERILYNANIPQREKTFFIVYNIIALLSIAVYFLAISSYFFSVRLGSLVTVLIAFGVLIGFFSLLSFASVVSRVNFHAVLIVIIWIFGTVFEPHWVKLIKYTDEKIKVFDSRPTLNQYFSAWVEQRKADIQQDSVYNVFFVLADGGASRSGYWTAAVLSKLEDTTRGKFSQQIFCLSGASGGSVGNTVFLTLLKYRDSLQKENKKFLQGANEFLRSDFLTYSIARMLGPDFIRPLFPLPFIDDRAAALEYALENGTSPFFTGKLKTPLSALIPFTVNNSKLPMLCINATRMQDGRPSVISTVRFDKSAFGSRIDILARLKVGEDMKLSTAAVIGARFPYISPAGRIDSSYYVDGGYFDNSGAGVVNEMIISLREYIRDSIALKPYLGKLRFYVIHVQNGWSGGGDIHKINSVVNDLAAPVLTLIGAYGTQTSVNDWRLIKYMEGLYYGTAEKGYHPVNLYSGKPREDEYPMNWVISNYYINKMNNQLNNPDMKKMVQWMQAKIKK